MLVDTGPFWGPGFWLSAGLACFAIAAFGLCGSTLLGLLLSLGASGRPMVWIALQQVLSGYAGPLYWACCSLWGLLAVRQFSLLRNCERRWLGGTGTINSLLGFFVWRFLFRLCAAF